MAVPRSPEGLGTAGKKLWRELQKEHDFDPAQTLILLESCRIADRLDGLNDIIVGKGVLRLLHMRMPGLMDDEGTATVNLTVDGVLSEARQQANVFKQLIVSLRIPDADTGKKPQQRGARGAYQPSTDRAASARVSSIDRARKRATGA